MTDLDHDQALDVADFDAFFAEAAEREPQGTPLRLFGRTYHLPRSLPALFTLQLQRVQSSARPEDIRRLLGSLFGPSAVDDFTEAGMSDRQLGIVLLWSPRTSSSRAPFQWNAPPNCTTSARPRSSREKPRRRAPARRGTRGRGSGRILASGNP